LVSGGRGRNREPGHKNLQVRSLDEINSVAMEIIHYLHPVEQSGVPRWKRVLDIAVIILTLPVLLLLAAATALTIRLASTGPILFRQERVGYLGRHFTCLKFRTMFAGAATISHEDHLQQLMSSAAPMTKLDARGDSRIIPFGRLIRSTGLAELPQMINVLRGEMSLVGPRPCLPFECQKYQAWQRERFKAVPGLTGLWQVSGKNRTTFDEMVNLDITYAKTKSLGLDVKIIFKTVPALLVQLTDCWLKAKPAVRATVTEPILIASAAPVIFTGNIVMPACAVEEKIEFKKAS
jgi:lipopolysaccharide/colanic/teichoic acid biosynthesis glycosyltransferase